MHTTTRERLARWLDGLAHEKTLIAPAADGSLTLYREVARADQIDWSTRPLLSAKGALFPQTERLLTIDRTGQQVTLHAAPPPGEQVIVGVRPCDVHGIRALDALFGSEPVDTTYARRRERTTIVGLACRQMDDTCFCTSVGGAPDDQTGMDVMLIEVEGGFAVEAITEKGAALIHDLPLIEASGDPPRAPLGAPLPLPLPEAWQGQFAAELWADAAERCIGCRACAYVCPTCRCFDVRDEALPGENGAQHFERIRGWDSCAGTGYRREASGHTPRAQKAERLRNRFLCKFAYFPQQVGPVACTGCGRCIDVCPVGVDITEVLAAVAGAMDAVEVAP